LTNEHHHGTVRSRQVAGFTLCYLLSILSAFFPKFHFSSRSSRLFSLTNTSPWSTHQLFHTNHLDYILHDVLQR
jgi:hypothetical protein